MSTPTDSVAPAPPTGTSNPWPLTQWWKRICDWIAALSPSGATEYDTGWVNVTPASGFTVGSVAQVRRVGHQVYGQGNLIGTVTNGVNVAICTLPAGFWPTRGDYRMPIGTSAYDLGVYTVTNPGGVVQVRFSVTGSRTINLSALQYITHG